MWWWLFLVALARGEQPAPPPQPQPQPQPTWQPLPPPCPPRCDCFIAKGYQFDCKSNHDNDTQLFLHAVLNSAVSVQCLGDTAPCWLVPRVDLAGGKRLERLSVKRCSPALLPCVLDAARAAGAASLMLMDPREELLPAHLAAVRPDTLLIYDAHSVSRLPAAALAALPALSTLRVNEARELRLHAGDLPPGAALTHLELSASGLDALPPGFFRGLPRLLHLQLWMNRIRTLDRDIFQGLESLKDLNLGQNLLSALPQGVFAATPRLGDLRLEMNRFERLEAGVFTGELLENITLHDNNANLTLEDLTFADLPALKLLVLRRSGLQALPGRLLRGSRALAALDLAGNSLQQLPPELFAGLAALARLDLSRNRLQQLPQRLFLPLKGLVDLNLDGNFIQVLPAQLFSGLRSFRRFSMDDNRLHTISAQAFLAADSLFSVSLAQNRLSLEQEEYRDMESYSPFHHLTNARTLILRGNRLRRVFDDWTRVLLQLTSLDLSFNNYTDLVIDELQFLSNKNVVDMRHNNISAVLFTSPPQPPPGAPAAPPAARTTLLLDGNPLRCDCRAYPLARVLRGDELPFAAPRFELGAAACAAPPGLRGRRAADVAPAELACELPRAACPERCRACAMRPAAAALELSCAELPRELPEPARFGAARVRLRLGAAPGPLRPLPASVAALDLAGIGLRELQLAPQPHLRELDLRNNLLRTVPAHVLNSNMTLYLANNSLACECETAEFVRALQRSSGVADGALLACADGRAPAALDPAALCAARDAALLAGAVFAALLLAALALAALLYAYNYEILVFLSSRGWLRWLVTEEILDADKAYDVFVAHSHHDVAFVQDELLPKLEREFGLRVCVHYRDWAVGELIPAQVVRSVERSRKTLVVLSAHFARSAWAGLEFRTAHCLALREGRARVLLVLLDEAVARDAALAPELRAYLATNTYLPRADRRFWERLRRALEPRDRAFTFLGKLRRAGGAGGLQAELNDHGQIVNAALEKDVV